jgi:energy-coupling factor transporter transmembrane protein EcfT
LNSRQYSEHQDSASPHLSALPPVIWLLNYVVFASAVAFANLSLFLTAISVYVLIAFACKTLPTHRSYKFALRIKWVFIAILVLYGWYTPGQLLLPALGDWSPSNLGMQMALLQIAKLLLLIFAIDFLLQQMTREEMLLAIYQLVLPLTFLGLSRERFAVRAMLTLRAVEALVSHKETITSVKNKTTDSSAGKLKQWTNTLLDKLVAQFQAATQIKTLQQSENTLALPEARKFSIIYFVLPISLAIVFLWVAA